MPYTTQAKIEAYTGRSLTAAEVVNLTDLLPAVDSIIEDILGTAYANVEATLYFDGGGSIVDLPGLTTITSVNDYDDTTDTLSVIDSDSYVAYPLNSARKFYIRLKHGMFADGVGNIAVVGNTDVAPSEIVLAASMIAADFLGGTKGEVSEEKIGDWMVKYSDVGNSSSATNARVLQLLAPYRDIMI